MPAKEPESTVVPETKDDYEPMTYQEIPATDEDGNPLATSRPASGTKRGAAATDKE